MPESGSCASSTTGTRRAGVPIYLAIDHTDRSEGWRIELKDRLAGIDREVSDRILGRFRRDAPPPAGRTQIGYVEVGGSRREIWNGFQVDGVATEVVAAGRPYLAPLMRMLDDGSPVGVVVVSLSGSGCSTGRSARSRSSTAGSWRSRA